MLVVVKASLAERMETVSEIVRFVRLMMERLTAKGAMEGE
jgi:hypothetical protein